MCENDLLADMILAIDGPHPTSSNLQSFELTTTPLSSLLKKQIENLQNLIQELSKVIDAKFYYKK